MRWSSLVLVVCASVSSVACERDAPANEVVTAPEPTSDEPIVVVPPALIDDEPSPLGLPMPQTYEVLDSLTRLLAPLPTDGDCSYLAEDAPSASIGATLDPYVRNADTREVVCVPATGGFQCSISLVKNTGGEDEEYGVFLQLHVDGAHTIDPRSIVCQLAG